MIKNGEEPFSHFPSHFSKLIWLDFRIRDFSLNTQYFATLTLFTNIKSLTLTYIKRSTTVLIALANHLKQLESMELSGKDLINQITIVDMGLIKFISNAPALKSLRIRYYNIKFRKCYEDF